MPYRSSSREYLVRIQLRQSCLTGQGSVSGVPLQMSRLVFIVCWSPFSGWNRLVLSPRQAAFSRQSSTGFSIGLGNGRAQYWLSVLRRSRAG